MFYKKNNERNAAKLEKIERDGPTCKRPKGTKGKASKPKPLHKEPGIIMFYQKNIVCIILTIILSLIFRMSDNIVR
jgi:hypothetical protein